MDANALNREFQQYKLTVRDEIELLKQAIRELQQENARLRNTQGVDIRLIRERAGRKCQL